MFLDDNPRFRGFQLGGNPRMGIQEGEAWEECPPGMVKVYLPEWPWHECVPEEEALHPSEVPSEWLPPQPVEEVEEFEEPVVPEIVEPEPVEPVPVAPPGKARFLRVNEQTGEIIDPDTNLPVQAIYELDDIGTPTIISVGLGLLAAALIGFGVIK